MSFAFFLIHKPIVEWLIDYTLCKEGFTGTCYLQAQGGRGTLEISGWGCAAGTLETIAYARASSAEFLLPCVLFKLPKSLLS